MAVDLRVVASLAGAIIVSRQAKTVAELQEAWQDATWMVAPQPKNEAYRAWQSAHGVQPTVPKPDFRTPEQRAKARARAAEKRVNGAQPV